MKGTANRASRSKSGGRTARFGAPLVVAVLTFLAFLPTLGNGFVTWDDDKNFLTNWHFRGLGPDNLGWMWTTFHLGHYVPLSWMTLGLDYEMWGMNPTGYHLTSLVLHAISAVLVYSIARRLLLCGRPALTGNPSLLTAGATVAALVFAVHPLRVESVAWATERRDVLSMCFYLASFLQYLRALDSADYRRRRLWISVGLFLCALLSKATAMTLPAALVIVNVYPLRRLGGERGWGGPAARRVYIEIVPYAALSAAAALLSIVALHPPNQLSLPAKLAVSAYGLVFYVVKTVLPTGLSPLYEMPPRVNPAAPVFVVSAVATVAITVIVCLAVVRRRWPAVTAAWIAFVAITVPMLGIVQNGPQIAADRYTYFSAPVLAMLVAAGVVGLRRAWRPMAGGVIALAIIALGTLTWRQTWVWHDSRSLWSRVLEVEPNSAFAHIAIASLLMNDGKLDESVVEYTQALAINPEYAEGHNNLGVALARQGRLDEARQQYERALEIKPRYDEPHSNLGVVLAQQGDLAGAIDQYQQALAVNPDYADAQVNWGNALVRLGRPDEALAHYAQAVDDRPDDAEAHVNWGVALARQGRFAEATGHFRAALAINPGNVEAKADLEQAMRLLGRVPRG